MCDPLTLAIMSTVVGVGSTVMQASATASAANYNAKISQQNALYAERRARDALERGAEEEQRVRLEGGQTKGKQIVSMAAGGLDLGFGSPLDVLIDTTTGVELDAARTRRNAQLEADDFDRQAWNYRANAGMERATARNAVTSGIIGSAGTVLSGVSDYRRSQALVT